MAERICSVEGCARFRESRGFCPVARRRPRSGAWMVDHDHRCCPGVYHCGGCIRGVVCGDCNAALGFAKDDPAILRALADYIENSLLEVAP